MSELQNTIKITENHIIENEVTKEPNNEQTKKKRTKKPPPEHCNICIENYNKSQRIPIKCEYCDFVACKECCKRYLLLENEQKCMNNSCERKWTPEFISNKFPKAFINTSLKTHKEKILFDKQKALMPSTQPIIENILKREEYEKKVLKAHGDISKAKDNLRDVQREYREYLYGPKKTETTRSTFIRACPSENCRGFLSTQWKCGLCEQWSCPECHEVKGKERDCEHTCNPDNVATAKLLNNDTKPCPKCGYGIFKIDGCDQMWCTQCHTAFSWRTGHIETTIHNPHYYEWARRQGNLQRNPNDVPCGREITHHMTTQIRNRYYVVKDYCAKRNKDKTKEEIDLYNQNVKRVFDKFIDLCRNIIHIRYVCIPRYRYNNDNVFQDLRIQYMRNFITEEKFKNSLQKEYKKSNKYREISEVITLLVETLTDITHRFVKETDDNNWEYNLDMSNEVDKIIEYCNECFIKISRTYDSIALSYENLIRS